MFTTETPEGCVRCWSAIRGRGRYKPGDLTRGLYYRDVGGDRDKVDRRTAAGARRRA